MADTIVAAATSSVRAGVGIVRVSGELAHLIARRLSARKELVERVAVFCIFDTGTVRDDGILLSFSSPRSYTGEDLVEFHLHGNPIIIAEVIRFCIDNGARLAQGGEFTRRAFENGKMDLTQAEAVMDIISAETKLQLENAAMSRSGRLYREIEGLLGEIFDLLAELNAAIDYPEEDIEAVTADSVRYRAAQIAERAERIAATYDSGRLIRSGVKVAIVGTTNVGKSSLLNRILDRDRAIVTAEAGTTRDTIEDRYEYKGLLFVITDTAGIRDDAHTIERLGIERAREAASQCDVIVSVADERGVWVDVPENKPVVFVRNKTDVAPITGSERAARPNIVGASAKKGENIDKIKQMIFDAACHDASFDGLVLTNFRHYECINAATQHLKAAAKTQGDCPEFLSADLLEASNELSKVTGTVSTDEVVSRIFARFCVGK